MTPQTLFYIILAIFIFSFVLDTVLDYLNAKSWKKQLPAELKAFYDEGTYAKAREYHNEKYKLNIISETLSFLIILGVLLFEGFGKISIWLQQFITDPIWLALAYFAVLSFAGSLIQMP